MHVDRRRSNLLGRCPRAVHHRYLPWLSRGSIRGEMAAALSRALKLPGKMRFTHFNQPEKQTAQFSRQLTESSISQED